MDETNAVAAASVNCREANNPIEDVTPPLLSVIVPVFNEAATIGEVVRQVQAVPIDKELILVDDGSTDGTTEQLRELERGLGLVVVRHDTNRGKGAAIRSGLRHARGEFTIIQDADLEYVPDDYPILLRPLQLGEAQVVYGSRYLDGNSRDHWRPFRYGVVLLNLAVRFLYGQRLTDSATCYKALPTNLLRELNLECERFEFCPEVTAKLCRLGVRILEVPAQYHPRSTSEGKKIRVRDGFEALQTYWRYRRWSP